LKMNEWIDLRPKGQPCGGSNRYGPNHAVMNYDVVNDVVLLFYYRLPVPGTPDGEFDDGPEALGVYMYDPKTNAWSEKLAALPKDFVGACANSFYATDLNAHFFHLAGDSADRGVIWVYRWKR
ncbi:MAG: hypothetical protein N2255_06915, partial [Kiritimatiellae bacterium]|nr:hypothetical protein [Kiritimatiellia bacterium]